VYESLDPLNVTFQADSDAVSLMFYNFDHHFKNYIKFFQTALVFQVQEPSLLDVMTLLSNGNVGI